jgi:hypothetical protein
MRAHGAWAHGPGRSRSPAHSHLPRVLVRQEGLPAPVGRVVTPQELHLAEGARGCSADAGRPLRAGRGPAKRHPSHRAPLLLSCAAPPHPPLSARPPSRPDLVWPHGGAAVDVLDAHLPRAHVAEGRGAQAGVRRGALGCERLLLAQELRRPARACPGSAPPAPHPRTGSAAQAPPCAPGPARAGCPSPRRP